MSRRNNRGHPPTKATINILFGKAAGRCQFDGCNKSVLFDDITLAQYNKSNVAHIVASSPNGARGDPVRSHQLSDKLENLMLLCPDHHKLIDDYEADYPEERLLEMKESHEQAIAAQCDLIYKEPSEVIVFESPIKGCITSKINMRQCFDAIIPQKIVGSTIGRRITLEVEADYRSVSFWEAIEKRFEQRYALLVDAIYEENENAHCSIFPIAPMPLIIKLGYKLGDKRRVDIYQYSRAQDTWKWSTEGQTNTFSTEKVTLHDGNRVALVLSLTADISISRITDTYDADVLYVIRAEHFGVDCIQSLADLTAFWKEYQTTCDKICNDYPKANEIGIFPAMPVSAAFEVGRRYMQGVYPRFKIYDDDHGFFETITIGGSND